jgi:ferredoxin/flavodoxin---NADP+ reductase
MTNHDCFDITIIGGGPAGLFSAFYSGLREMKTKIIDFQPHLGGKVHIYPEKTIWDVGGIPPISGAKLIEQLVEQGLTFDPEVVLNEKVVSIDKKDDIFEIYAASGNVHYSKTVIIATGSGILNPQKLTIQGADRFEITNLHYTVRSLQQFKNKTVLISGGGNSAIDWANELEPIANKVYIAYRKEQLEGHEAMITQLLNSSIKSFPHTKISNLIAGKSHNRIDKVELVNCLTGEKSLAEVDDVIISHGYDQDLTLFENSPLNIHLIDTYFIEGNEISETKVEGLYAAGDILKHKGKVHLIAGAFHDAANAVNRAKQYIEPEASEVAMVSSHNEIFQERNKKLFV